MPATVFLKYLGDQLRNESMTCVVVKPLKGTSVKKDSQMIQCLHIQVPRQKVKVILGGK